jgi:hypothetical protein
MAWWLIVHMTRKVCMTSCLGWTCELPLLTSGAKRSLEGAVDILASCGYYTMSLWPNYGVLGILSCGYFVQFISARPKGGCFRKSLIYAWF